MAVFDKEPSPDARARDWTVVLHWALPLLERLVPADVLARLTPEAVCNPHLAFGEEGVECLPVFNGRTGDVLFRSAMPGARRVSRRRLRRLLLARDGGVSVEWDRKLSAITILEEGGVRLTFEDGATAEADYVLGADGARSKVREILFDGAGQKDTAHVTESGYMFSTVNVRFRDAAKVAAVVDTHPVAAIMMGADSVGAMGGTFSSVLCAKILKKLMGVM